MGEPGRAGGGSEEARIELRSRLRARELHLEELHLELARLRLEADEQRASRLAAEERERALERRASVLDKRVRYYQREERSRGGASGREERRVARLERSLGRSGGLLRGSCSGGLGLSSGLLWGGHLDRVRLDCSRGVGHGYGAAQARVCFRGAVARGKEGFVVFVARDARANCTGMCKRVIKARRTTAGRAYTTKQQIARFNEVNGPSGTAGTRKWLKARKRAERSWWWSEGKKARKLPRTGCLSRTPSAACPGQGPLSPIHPA